MYKRRQVLNYKAWLWNSISIKALLARNRVFLKPLVYNTARNNEKANLFNNTLMYENMIPFLF